MSIKIGSNIAALGAQRNLGRATEQLGAASLRVASGLRINKAGDDAAGLSIAESLKADTKIYKQSLRNINDGMSYLNIAEGSLTALSTIVIRTKELAEQAANGVYSSSQRKALNSEAAALVQEYNRIVNITAFNGKTILQGQAGSTVLQQGIGLAEQTNINVGSLFGVAAGDATFSNTLIGGNSYLATAGGDFNNDGLTDFIRNSTLGYTDTLISNGDGTFRISASHVSAVGGVATGDFNGDGNLDYVFTRITTAGFLYLGNGDGTFQSAVTFNGGYQVSSGDINGDGLSDLIGVNGATGAVSLFFGQRNGTLASGGSLSLGVAAGWATIGDLNNDGNADLAITTSAGNVYAYLGNGNGTFLAPKSSSLGTNTPQNIVLGDFNGDGFLDAASGSYSGSNIGVVFGDGKGLFSGATTYATTGGNTYWVEAGDFNGDGITDLVASNYGAGDKLDIFLGSGNGTFTRAGSFGQDADPTQIVVGDFNGDGVSDIFAATSGAAVGILLGNSDITGRRKNIISSFDLTSVYGAKQALTKSTDILNRINRELGFIGALQSRLQTSYGNLSNRTLNYSAAAAQITDADLADESANLVKYKITQQAAAAILGQANQAPELALKLLKT